MKKSMFLIFCTFFKLLVTAYEGSDLVDEIFSQVVDIANPTLEEYRMIEDFLLNGNRPYIAPIGLQPNHRNVRNLKLVGENGEMPIHKIFPINCSLEHKIQCIVLYSSYNYPYPGKLQLLLNELKECGYKGHVLFRVGGYPNMANDGLRLCHIAYAWKIASLLEARDLGYRYIMWLDSSCHPLCDLKVLFKMIYKNGYLFAKTGFNLDYPYSLGQHLPGAIHALKLVPEQLCNIPHICSPIIGVNVHDPVINKFLDEWYAETLNVEPCISWYPEELCYSVVAWRNGLKPTCTFGDIFFTVHDYKPTIKHEKPMYLDFNRGTLPQWDPSELD